MDHRQTAGRPLLSFGIFLFIFSAVAKTAEGRPNSNKRNNSKNSKWIGSETYAHGRSSAQDKERYSSLPHTIFSPQGRLYNVERAGLASSTGDDFSSVLVLALKFGCKQGEGSAIDNGDSDCNNSDESILILSTAARSPHLYPSSSSSSIDSQNENVSTKRTARRRDGDNKLGTTSDGNAKEQEPEPLWTHENYSNNGASDEQLNRPVLILSDNIIVGTGGNAVDSAILRDKITETFLSLSKSSDGMRSTHRMNFGTVRSSILARKLADSMQIPTQSASGGRILASAALVVGTNELHSSSLLPIKIWRVDPTGQFWDCQAAAVGRGAGVAEGVLLQHVEQKLSNNDDGNYDSIEELLASVANEDIKEYLESLSFEDALVLASDCIISALQLKPHHMHKYDQIGLQGMIVQNSEHGKRKKEKIHPIILKEAFQRSMSML